MNYAERLMQARGNRAALSALYVELIGYCPFEDDEGATEKTVFCVLADWVREACASAGEPAPVLYAVGDTVGFVSPLSDDESTERFTVVEFRDPRVLVEFQCSMNIKPQSVYLAADLKAV